PSPASPSRRSAAQTSPGTTAHSSGSAPAATLPPAARTVRPGTYRPAGTSPALRPAAPGRSLLPAAPRGSPACSPETRLASPTPPDCGWRSAFLPGCRFAPSCGRDRPGRRPAAPYIRWLVLPGPALVTGAWLQRKWRNAALRRQRSAPPVVDGPWAGPAPWEHLPTPVSNTQAAP